MLWENLYNQNGTIHWVCIYTCVYIHAYPNTGKFHLKQSSSKTMLCYIVTSSNDLLPQI